MHRHVLAAQKARIDASIREAASARYQKVGPDAQACVSGLVPVIIEVPRGQRNKLEFDKETGTLQLDRVLHSTCFYPGDYGFVPRTLCPDGDPIDVLVLSKFPLAPGCLVDCRIVGVMDMEDEKGGDAKLIAVVATEPRTLSITDIDHVPSHIKAEIQQFFELYKALEAAPGKPKWVKIRSVSKCNACRHMLFYFPKNSLDVSTNHMSRVLKTLKSAPKQVLGQPSACPAGPRRLHLTVQERPLRKRGSASPALSESCIPGHHDCESRALL
jgi:inorganic pyrophosphatase